MSFCLVRFLRRQIAFSIKTWGPPDKFGIPFNGRATVGHIRKELEEVLRKPHDLEEWIDIVLLALDGAMRAGHTPNQVVAGLEGKFEKNTKRKWPDWRKCPPDKGIEHDRTFDAAASA